MIRPRSSTRIWFARTIVESLCAMTMQVRCAIKCSSASWIKRSVVVSTLAVASSRIKIGGSFNRARAIEIRCFSPTLNFTPRSPTTLLSPSGKRSINVRAFAAPAASSNCSSVAAGFPMRRFSRIVPLNRKLS